MSNRWDEDSGGEADADGKLFWKSVCAFAGMNENEVSEDQTAED